MKAVSYSAGRRGTSVSDTIRLSIPLDERFRSVPTLVLGGIGSRLDLPYEQTDDLQLAVLSVLDSVEGDDAELVVEVAESGIAITVGPLAADGDRDGLGRVLSRLVDRVADERRDGADYLTLHVSRAPRDP